MESPHSTPKKFYFLLNEQKQVIPCDDRDKWIRWIEDGGNRRVAEDWIGDVQVSTVFLAMNHNWWDGEPILFETMIFGGPLHHECWRYSTYDDALSGHAHAVKKVRVV